MPHVAVIGGGPAGCVTALILARAGFAVDLLEQHAFPRDKVCGECLSGLGMDVLRRAGVAGEIESLNPADLKWSLLHPMEGPTIEVPLPRASVGISRKQMDCLLLNAAKRAGATVHQPARCEGVDELDSNNSEWLPRLRWRDLRTNERHTSNADWIVIADGKGALLPRQTRSTRDLGIKTHFTGVNGPRDAIELFAGRGNYGGLAAIEADQWNAAFSVPASLVRENSGDLQRVFDQVVAANPALRERVGTAKRTGPWLASPLPRFAVAHRRASRVVPVGNAAAALEPVGGEGMGLALRSGELAALAIIEAQASRSFSPIENLTREFNQLWQVRRTVCRGIAMLFSTEYLANSLAPLLAANVGIPSAIMRWAGKAEGLLEHS
jgi:flavin-dependent dehydrogenase